MALKVCVSCLWGNFYEPVKMEQKKELALNVKQQPSRPHRGKSLFRKYDLLTKVDYT